ncbi:MAG: hypothetical protein JW881_12805 [Spirochaetales bacterium]|nr:hypothetical protein [Spirochaetales bacterium]
MDTGKISINYVDFFKGAVWFFPSLLITLFFQQKHPGSYKAFFLYIHFFLKDHFCYTGAGLLGYMVFQKFRLPRTSKSSMPNLFSFFSGFYSLVAIQYFFMYYGDYDFYLLFILPFMWLSTILLLSFLTDKFFDAFRTTKILYGSLLFFLLVALGFITCFYMANLVLLSFILSLVLFAGSCATYYFLRDI